MKHINKLERSLNDYFGWSKAKMNCFVKMLLALIIITTNKSFEQWGDIFADSILASAILDRVIHHSEIVKINGASYR